MNREFPSLSSRRRPGSRPDLDAGLRRDDRKVERRVFLAGLAAALSLHASGLPAAETPAPAALTPQDRGDLDRIAAYLDGITTLYARFRQVASDGTQATGQMWVERPGRMRFEYDPPSPILLIADRFYVYYVDKQLAEMSKIGLKSTPAWFLLRDRIAFDNDLVVTRFERGANAQRITAVEKNQPELGSVTMVFGDNPLALRQWTILDQQGRSTTVSLGDVRLGMPLDAKLFVYQDPYAQPK